MQAVMLVWWRLRRSQRRVAGHHYSALIFPQESNWRVVGFSVSASGGLTIDSIDLGDHDNTPILLKNTYNTTIAASSGTVSSGDTAESLRIVLSNASTNTGAGNNYATSYNVTLQNLTLRDGVYIKEDYCDFEGQGDRNNRVTNITGGTVDMCYE